MLTFVLSPALILAAYVPVSLSGNLRWRLHTGSESHLERVRLLRWCK